MRQVSLIPVVLPLADVFTGDLETLWVTADSHFKHAAIARLCDRPADHEARMFDGWKRNVAPTDTVLHLGDAWFGNAGTSVAEALALPGKVILLRGNHDRSNANWYVTKLGWTVTKTPLHSGVLTFDYESQRIALSHAPLSRRHLDWDVNVHGHIHSNGYHPEVANMRRAGETKHLCVSVECTDYAPVKLLDLLRGTATCGNFETLGIAALWKDRDLL